MGIKDKYAKIRTGKSFLVLLSAFCAFWSLWNWMAPEKYRFDDPGFPLLTLLLSIEASIAASVIITENQENDEKQKDQLKYMLHLSEATLELLEHSRLNLLNQNAEALKELVARQKAESQLSSKDDPA